MSIDKITDRIKSDANAEAGKTLIKADQEKHAVLEKAGIQAEAIRQEAKEKAEQDALLIKERKISVAELEARKLRLAAKQKAIEACFARTLENLASMEQKDYLDLMAATLVKTGAAEGELLLNPRDRDRLGEMLVEKANLAIKPAEGDDSGAADQNTLVLSADTISARGGFVLRKGSMELNSTLEVMVGDVTEEMTPEVVRILFGKQPVPSASC